MSSATPSDPNAARRLANSLGDRALNQNGTGGSAANIMSPRQIALDRLWRYYRVANYDGRKCDWDGREVVEHTEHDAIATSGVVPGGFYEAGGDSLPNKFRRPYAPLPLARLVVNRLTALLFSNSKCPKAVVIGDADSEDWLNAACEQSAFWTRMARARTFGGAMGACAGSFKFENGELVVEAHDPRWTKPVWRNRATLSLKALEIRYWFAEQEQDDDGNWIEILYWFRRVIDDVSDTTWPKVHVGDGTEPNWKIEENESVEHGFGACPAEWAQNTPVEEEIDGDPDCHGAFDMIESIDALRSCAQRGITANCDPTLNINTDAELGEVRKGNDNAIKLEKGANAGYLEITGAGPKMALEMADKELARFELVVRCHLDTSTKEGPAKTATEVDRAFSAMLENAGELREVYGPFAKRLLTKIDRAARTLGTTKRGVGKDGLPAIVRETFALPPKVVTDPATGETTLVPRKQGPGGAISLRWPPLVTPSVADALSATQAATAAKAGGLIDDEHATRYVAHYYGIDDVAAVVAAAKLAQKEMADAMTTAAMGQLSTGHLSAEK